MIVAVDTNILLDILIPNPSFLESSRRTLNQYVEKAPLIIGEVVYAELAAQFDDELLFKTFLVSTGIRQVPSGNGALWTASRSWKRYNEHKKRKFLQSRRVLADFLVGAHAAVHAGNLITRDQGFYRTYFQNLKIIDPGR
ncbi:MAG: PIN domain-containing protein [Deltaproteobacteria bacterium]|nr:PIN domain-containing protein [Deltaproteobacteria bacterium]MBI4412343.1 PIN domain-containing protein [Deltaproteobacteria bacterium]